MHIARIAFVFFACCVYESHAQELQRLLQSGDSCYAQERTEEALRYYNDAYVRAPQQSETLLRLARTYSDLGWLHLKKDSTAEMYYLHAEACAETLLQIDPNAASSHFWMALTKGSLIPFRTVSEKIHIGKEVRYHAQKTVELDSTFSLAYIILAIFERECAQLSWMERAIARIIFGEDLSGSLVYSEELLSKAAMYDPENSYAYYEMYWTYTALGKKDAAAESLRRVLALPVKSQREGRQHQLAGEYLAKLELTTR